MNEELIFDTHAHYDDDKYDDDRDDILDKMKARGVGNIVNVGASYSSSKDSYDLAKRFHFIYCSIGVHPNEVNELNDEKLAELKSIASKSKVVAIGEIGLDYYWEEPDRRVQKDWFEKQLDIAEELGLPVIIHSRDAAEDTMNILKQRANKHGGVIHCYSYGLEQAKEYISMGFYIGIGGALTFKNNKKTKQVVEGIDINRIVLETDAPYLAPEPNRGKRNDSVNLIYVANEIAKLKGITTEQVIKITADNAKRLYHLV